MQSRNAHEGRGALLRILKKITMSKLTYFEVLLYFFPSFSLFRYGKQNGTSLRLPLHPPPPTEKGGGGKISCLGHKKGSGEGKKEEKRERESIFLLFHNFFSSSSGETIRQTRVSEFCVCTQRDQQRRGEEPLLIFFG